LVSLDHKIDYCNNNLNEEQRSAVKNIVEAKFRWSCPYIIFGPPGTGVTIIL
jgi:hypothetical protein